MSRLDSPSRPSQQNTCITFIQRRPNIFDVGPTLYKCYTNVLCLLGSRCVTSTKLGFQGRRYQRSTRRRAVPELEVNEAQLICTLDQTGQMVRLLSLWNLLYLADKSDGKKTERLIRWPLCGIRRLMPPVIRKAMSFSSTALMQYFFLNNEHDENNQIWCRIDSVV